MTDILRKPPCSIDAEQAVLGALLLAPESLANVTEFLTVEDFYRREHRVVFDAITTLAAASEPFDAVTIGDWIERNGDADAVGGPAYVAQLAANVAGAANIVAYAEIVAEKSRQRKLIEAGTKLTGDAFNGAQPAAMLAGNAIRTLSLLATERGGALEPATVGLRRLFAQMQERYEAGPKLLGFATPWAKLNDWTKGLRDGNLIVIGARPGMGKSVMAGQLAVTAAMQGLRTAWFSVEMTADECMARAVACLADIDYAWVEQPAKNDPDSETNWPRVTRAFGALQKAPLLIDETAGLSIHQLMARARRAHLQAPLRLIVIDHLHDMRINPKQARFDVGEIAQGAKTLAKEFHCPVVLAAQLNRALSNRNDKRPVMTDLRESGDIEQKADVIVFLHRDDYYDPEDRPGVVQMMPAKGRNLAQHGAIYLRNRFDRMRLDDWEGPMPACKEDSTPRVARARSAKRWAWNAQEYEA